MSGPYSIPRLLTAEDYVAEFDCGELTLDEWIKKRALANQANGASRTYVTTNAGGHVVGFYCLCTASVQNRSAPSKVRRNQPDSVPVILLGRLAVDSKEQNQGLGAHLLRDAITHAVQAAELVGVRALLVHALHDDAKRFYLNFDFEQSPTDELHLFLLIKDAHALVHGASGSS